VETREKPAGTIRITATDYGLSDIVADRFDIGVRCGDQVAKEICFSTTASRCDRRCAAASTRGN